MRGRERDWCFRRGWTPCTLGSRWNVELSHEFVFCARSLAARCGAAPNQILYSSILRNGVSRKGCAIAVRKKERRRGGRARRLDGRGGTSTQRKRSCATRHEVTALDTAAIVSESEGEGEAKDEPQVANQHRRKGCARAGANSDQEDDLESFNVGVDDTRLELEGELANLLWNNTRFSACEEGRGRKRTSTELRTSSKGASGANSRRPLASWLPKRVEAIAMPIVPPTSSAKGGQRGFLGGDGGENKRAKVTRAVACETSFSSSISACTAMMVFCMTVPTPIERICAREEDQLRPTSAKPRTNSQSGNRSTWSKAWSR